MANDGKSESQGSESTANLRTKILDFRGFDSNIILVLRGGILMSIGYFPEVVESTILSRDSFSREIGCTATPTPVTPLPLKTANSQIYVG